MSEARSAALPSGTSSQLCSQCVATRGCRFHCMSSMLFTCALQMSNMLSASLLRCQVTAERLAASVNLFKWFQVAKD